MEQSSSAKKEKKAERKKFTKADIKGELKLLLYLFLDAY